MPPPRKIHILAQEDFDRLLAWLDQDRDRAGLTYEKIRWRLITIFAARSCPVPEDLADETIDRVARRASEIATNYTGDKALYFFGVATNVHHEYLKRPALLERGEALQDDYPYVDPALWDNREQTHDCLERCLTGFSTAERAMILRYYALDKQAKIGLRKQMADELGISLNTLRLRVLRMKEKLQPCVERCLGSREI